MKKIKKIAPMVIVLGVCSAFFSSSIIAAPYLLNTQIPLGAVNGTIVNNQTVRISKILTQPALVNVYRADINNDFNALVIKNATIIKQVSDDITIRIKQALLTEGNAVVYATLGVWVDGQRIPTAAMQEGDTVNITTPIDFKHIELRIIGPLLIELPKAFKGDFNVDIDIEGRDG